MGNLYRFWVYILTNMNNRVLYIGMTNNILRRMHEHKSETHEGFTRAYHTHKLVYVEEYQYVDKAIAREKQLKKYARAKKIALIEQTNPHWEDLTSSFYTQAS